MRFWPIIGVLGLGVGLAALLWGVLLVGFSAADDTRPGPTVTVENTVWGTRIHPGDDAHESFAVWVDLIAPQDFEARTFQPRSEYLVAACQAIVDEAERFVPEGVARSDLQHVDINFDFDGERGWPVEMTVVVENGACIAQMQSGGHDLAFDPEENPAFSAHTGEETFFAYYRAWGLTEPSFNFASRNGARVMEVEYGYVTAIARDLKTIQALDLCVLALSRLGRDMSILGIAVDPAKYPRMTIQIVNRTRAGIVTTTKKYGSAEILIQDARCVVPEADAA
ncbi:MAG: hypothetical protein AAGF60_05730 [Pseudomonadota bacterium]